MNSPTLLEFAAAFVNGIEHHKDVRSEALAEAFRDAYGMSPFPNYRELCEVAAALGVRVERLPTSAPMHGVNAWGDDDGPTIALREDLGAARAETTLCHELREMLENAFKRVKPTYVGLDTHDNARMNPRSDAFGSALLMQAEGMHGLLASFGYDLATFAEETHRSLPSVIIRAQSVLAEGSTCEGPIAGVWLYEAGWEIVQSGTAKPEDLRVIALARLKGFSLSAKNQATRALAAQLPAYGHGADALPIVTAALEARRTTCREVSGLDLFDDWSFAVVVEPIFRGLSPWRAILSVVKRECLPMMQPWVERLDLHDALQHTEPL